MTTKPEIASQYGTFREPKPEATALSDSHVHEAAPAALGWNVLQFAPPGPVQLTTAQRDDVVRELHALKQRIADLKMALGDGAGWFDRAMAAEKERDRLRAESAALTARVAEHLVMFKSNDETFAHYREVIVNQSALTDQLRAENASLRGDAEAKVERCPHGSSEACQQCDLADVATWGVKPKPLRAGDAREPQGGAPPEFPDLAELRHRIKVGMSLETLRNTGRRLVDMADRLDGDVKRKHEQAHYWATHSLALREENARQEETIAKLREALTFVRQQQPGLMADVDRRIREALKESQ